MHLYADGFTKVSLSNNNLRVTLVHAGSNDSVTEVGTLILPANQAGAFVSGLAKALQQIGTQQQERSSGGKAGTSKASNGADG
jgi:hypothetical protein